MTIVYKGWKKEDEFFLEPGSMTTIKPSLLVKRYTVKLTKAEVQELMSIINKDCILLKHCGLHTFFRTAQQPNATTKSYLIYLEQFVIELSSLKIM